MDALTAQQQPVQTVRPVSPDQTAAVQQPEYSGIANISWSDTASCPFLHTAQGVYYQINLYDMPNFDGALVTQDEWREVARLIVCIANEKRTFLPNQKQDGGMLGSIEAKLTDLGWWDGRTTLLHDASTKQKYDQIIAILMRNRIVPAPARPVALQLVEDQQTQITQPGAGVLLNLKPEDEDEDEDRHSKSTELQNDNASVSPKNNVKINLEQEVSN